MISMKLWNSLKDTTRLSIAKMVYPNSDEEFQAQIAKPVSTTDSWHRLIFDSCSKTKDNQIKLIMYVNIE